MGFGQPIPEAQNGTQQHQQIANQAPAPSIGSVAQPTTQIKEPNTKNRTQNVWREAFGPATWPNWALVIVGIGGIYAAIKTLKTIEAQARLQKTAMRQWIVTGNWTQGPRYMNGILAEIDLQIPIVNETNYPLRLESVVAELNGIEQIKTVRSQLAPLGRDAHVLTFPIRLEGPQVSEYQQNRFTLVVECRVTFVDVFEDQQIMKFNRLYRCGPQEFEQEGKYNQNQNPN